jgi:glycosyltransferase involved in cell wall biosynthesis
MKVLHIISSSGMYGAEAVVLNLCRALNEASHSSVLGVFSNSSNPNLQLHQSAMSQGIESHEIPCDGQIDRAAVARIRELVSQTGADIVHAHGYKADIYVYYALRKMKIPFVSTCHNWVENDEKTWLYGIADRFILRRYKRVIAVSDDVQSKLRKAGVSAGNTRVIKNGIDLRPFDRASGVLKDELGWGAFQVIGLVGRLSKEKGVDTFLRAAAQVVEEVPSARFIVAGDGPDHAELEAMIGQLRMQERFKLLGRREDIPFVYASLDVLVSSSRYEGLPMAILEGMASRLPVIATAVGEVPSVITDGRTGVLVPAENQDLLAAAIIEMLQNAAKRQLLGGAARQVVEEQFSAQRMATDYLRVYEDAVAGSAKDGGLKVRSSLASQ